MAKSTKTINLDELKSLVEDTAKKLETTDADRLINSVRHEIRMHILELKVFKKDPETEKLQKKVESKKEKIDSEINRLEKSSQARDEIKTIIEDFMGKLKGLGIGVGVEELESRVHKDARFLTRDIVRLGQALVDEIRRLTPNSHDCINYIEHYIPNLTSSNSNLKRLQLLFECYKAVINRHVPNKVRSQVMEIVDNHYIEILTRSMIPTSLSPTIPSGLVVGNFGTSRRGMGSSKISAKPKSKSRRVPKSIIGCSITTAARQEIEREEAAALEAESAGAIVVNLECPQTLVRVARGEDGSLSAKVSTPNPFHLVVEQDHKGNVTTAFATRRKK